ncbi:hypothetical protein RYX36_036383 [Vicia faba]
MTVEDAGEILELFYQRRCCDYFSVDSLELQKMRYMLLRDESSVSIRNADTLPGSVILLPCGWCSLKARLILIEDAGEILGLFYQRDYFSVDLLELQKMGYMLLRDESSVSIRNADTLPGSVILLPCGWCSLKARLVLSMDDS